MSTKQFNNVSQISGYRRLCFADKFHTYELVILLSMCHSKYSNDFIYYTH